MNAIDSTPPLRHSLSLAVEPALERLGDDYYDRVEAAEFPQHILRFRNDELLQKLGVAPQSVSDEEFVAAFGKFQNPSHPFLALRYHGYQFGEYNPRLGDGRGFLYAQVRGVDGLLYDLGTKGSGTTPYSRGGDGRLTLKGGVREVIAAEALHRAGVCTSRCLSLVETGEGLWRGDEPSPTRSSVMIRMQRSHIRFGTFERLHYFKRKDLIATLLDFVIEQYYPHLANQVDRYALFYAELVQRVARLAAQWMAAGFCHAVLNTDNMAITGESFDYGPFAFIQTYDPKFAAAYFDYSGLYAYGRQPAICRENLAKLQLPLNWVIAQSDLDAGLEKFWDCYQQTYQERMMQKLGVAAKSPVENSVEKAAIAPTFSADPLLETTIQMLQEMQVGYSEFFAELTRQFHPNWREDVGNLFTQVTVLNDELVPLWETWKMNYFQRLLSMPESEFAQIPDRLRQHNPLTVPVRPLIEAAWNPIAESDDWTEFYDLLNRIRA